MGYIYKIINKVTNKIYIGQTIQDLENRWKGHCKSNSNCRYLKSSIEKYGIDNFIFKLICICFDEDLDKYEIDYIEKYKSLVPNGYNLRKGGNGGKHHEETKKKISETLKNKINRVFSKPQLGKPHTEETKKKISQSLKGKKKSNETKENMSNSRKKYKVLQFSTDGNLLNTFNGCSEAAKSVNCSKSIISLCCNGKINSVKNFIWKYEHLL
jgi:group I intron endonuclease